MIRVRSTERSNPLYPKMHDSAQRAQETADKASLAPKTSAWEERLSVSSRTSALVLALTIGAGCSSARYGAQETGAPSVILPAHFAEGHTGKAEVSPSGDGGGAGADAATTVPAVAAHPGVTSTLPDPAPLVTKSHWEFFLEYDRGTIRLKQVKPVSTARPMETARRVGRFAIELWIGRELLDRVRFDFPMLAADELEGPEPRKKRPLHTPVQFGPGARTSQHVLVPASDRATSAQLVDRSTGEITPLPWPPVLPEPAPPASSGHP